MVGEAGPIVNRTLRRRSSQIIVDAAAVEYCDGAGIALLIELLRRPRPAGASVSVRGLQERFAQLLQQFDPHKFEVRPAPPPMRVPLTEAS